MSLRRSNLDDAGEKASEPQSQGTVGAGRNFLISTDAARAPRIGAGSRWRFWPGFRLTRGLARFGGTRFTRVDGGDGVRVLRRANLAGPL